MDRQEIIRMAREACDQAPREDWNSTAWVFGDESLERFAALVAAAEREARAGNLVAVDRLTDKGREVLAKLKEKESD